MPTFKHPCPHCGNYINRDVAVCPFCATRDPFAPARCANCRTVIEDASWTACPRCGQSLIATNAQAAANDALHPPVPPTPSAQATPRPMPGPPPQTPAPPPPTPTTASAPPQLAPQPSAAPQPDATTCTGCGAPLAAGARFCTVCGTLAG